MMRFSSLFARAGRDQRGVATIEFALWSVLILSILVVSADFGIYTFHKERLKRAVSEASIAAFNARSNVDADRVAQYVTASTHIPGMTPAVTVTCNGGGPCTNSNRQCACISLTDASFSTAGSCGSACPSGGLSGYYLTISAQTTYHHVVMPNPWLDGKPIAASVTVRL